MQWLFKFWYLAHRTGHLILTPNSSALAEAGMMCSEAPTTGAVLRLEIKNMLCFL